LVELVWTVISQWAAANPHVPKVAGREVGVFTWVDLRDRIATLCAEYAREQVAKALGWETSAREAILANEYKALESQLDAARGRETRLREALMFYVDWYAAGDLHDDGCPEDDTCACEKVAKVNAALAEPQ
jgi:hypothetical protein